MSTVGQKKYASKKQRCSLPQYRRSASCIAKPHIRHTGTRRLPGNPLVPCLATENDLQKLTIKQLIRYGAKNGIRLPKVSEEDPRKKPLKAEYINAILSGSGSCNMRAPRDPSKASLADLGAFLKTRGVEPPRTCGQMMTKETDTEPSHPYAVPCHRDYEELVRRVAAENRPAIARLPAAVTATAAPGPGSVLGPAQAMSPAAAMAAAANPPAEQGPPRAVAEIAVTSQSGTAAGAGVLVSPETGEEAAAVVDIIGHGNAIRFDVKKGGPVAGTQYGDYYTEPFNAAWAAGNKSFIVDKQCAVDAGSLLALTSKNSVMVQNCQMINGQRNCGRGLLLITQLDTPGQIEEWKHRTQQYRDLNHFLPDSSLAVEAAWTCDSKDVTYWYRSAWSGYRATYIKGGLMGFVAVSIPEGHTFYQLREFTRQVSDPSRPGYLRTMYNYLTNITWGMVASRYSQSMVPTLIELLYELGIKPDAMSPETFGVLVRNGVSLGNSQEIYPYNPVILPTMDRLVTVGDPKFSAAVGTLASADITKVFELIKKGLTQEGVKATWQNRTGILGLTMWAITLSIGAYAIAYYTGLLSTPWIESIYSAASAYVTTTIPTSISLGPTASNLLYGGLGAAKTVVMGLGEMINQNRFAAFSIVALASAMVYGPYKGLQAYKVMQIIFPYVVATGVVTITSGVLTIGPNLLYYAASALMSRILTVNSSGAAKLPDPVTGEVKKVATATATEIAAAGVETPAAGTAPGSAPAVSIQTPEGPSVTAQTPGQPPATTTTAAAAGNAIKSDPISMNFFTALYDFAKDHQTATVATMLLAVAGAATAFYMHRRSRQRIDRQMMENAVQRYRMKFTIAAKSGGAPETPQA